jgi:hypothetical protein
MQKVVENEAQNLQYICLLHKVATRWQPAGKYPAWESLDCYQTRSMVLK